MLRKLFVVPAVVLASVIGAVAPVSQAQAQSQPFIAQTMIFAGNFCPAGWAEANGQLLAISENDTLFALIGTTYGGDGQETFGLPDLRGRLPIGDGAGSNGLPTRIIGEMGGNTSFTITSGQMPSHTHVPRATNVLADRTGPLEKYIGLSLDPQFSVGPPNVNMAADMVSIAGGSQPVDHRGPYLGLKMCMSLFGVFPSPQ